MVTKPFSLLQKILIALVSSAAVFILAAVIALISFHVTYIGRIYPGVSVGDVDLSGQTTAEAAATLAQVYTYPQDGQLLLQDGENSWTVSPAQVGLSFDTQKNAVAATLVGRSGPFWTRLYHQFGGWFQGIIIPPAFTFDQNTAQSYLETLAAEINRPTIEAAIEINGTEVIHHQGQIGRQLDTTAALAFLEIQTQTLEDAEIPLIINETPPAIISAEAEAEIARGILSAPFLIKVPGKLGKTYGPWAFAPEDLAGMLTFDVVSDPGGAYIQIGLSEQRFIDFLNEVAPDLEQPTENPRFIFNDETRKLELIQPAVVGQTVDVEATLAIIRDTILTGEHSAVIDMAYVNPEVADDALAGDLGISELVSSHTTYFYGSDSARRHNIATAAGRFHGLLVPPGASFSMADVLGDISLDSGYAEAWIIYGDRTIKGVGGGVCQVSTTLFRTVFFGGYPILERYSHSYRVYYYEQTYNGGHDAKWAGLDATVYVPLVDFKFTNDSESWMLMETYVGGSYLTWKFYSASDGRVVEWDTTGLTKVKDPPEPKYIKNDDLAKNEIKQVDWAVEGADVTVTRTVLRDDAVLYEDIFKTHYSPWAAVCEYGPKTQGMPPKNPDPDNPCKPDKVK
ncbi:MAG: VanW family protein [Chloroflexota bacterium]